jgi:hypothetical protein
VQGYAARFVDFPIDQARAPDLVLANHTLTFATPLVLHRPLLAKTRSPETKVSHVPTEQTQPGSLLCDA